MLSTIFIRREVIEHMYDATPKTSLSPILTSGSPLQSQCGTDSETLSLCQSVTSCESISVKLLPKCVDKHYISRGITQIIQ